VVTEADLERALDLLRDRASTFKDVDRPVQLKDFVVVNYTGTCEAKPIVELAPTAKSLTEQKAFWLEIKPESFLPGFTEQLVGAQKNDHRTVTVTFPADFLEKPLAGKQGVFEVEIVQVKEKELPALTDEFAKAYGAENLAQLQAGVRHDLENELKYKQRSDAHNQLLTALMARANFELPESVLEAETRNVVFDIVRQNKERGVTKEAIDEKKDEIYAFANRSARDRVKIAFLLSRIAEQEGIKASAEEVNQRIRAMALQNNIPADKLAHQLEEKNAKVDIAEEIVNAKVLDFLQLNAKVEDNLPVPSAT